MARADAVAFNQVDFSGGLNFTDGSNLIADNELQDGHDFNIGIKGKTTKRLGYTRWSDPGLAIKRVWGSIYVTFSNGDTKKFEVRNDGSRNRIYEMPKGAAAIILDDDAGNPYELDNLLNVYFELFQDIVFAGNGKDANFEIVRNNDNQVYVVRRTGIVTPTTKPVATEGTAGALGAGAYVYAVTFVRKEGAVPTVIKESNGIKTDSLTIAASKQIDLTNLPISTDPQVTGRRIYRTAAGGTAFRFLVDIDNNTATTHTDNVPDATLNLVTNLFDADEGTSTWEPLPPVRYLKVVKFRMWGWGDPDNPHRLYHSRQGDLIAIRARLASDFKDIDDNNGQEATALAIDDGGLLIFKERAIYQIPNGDVKNPFIIVNIGLGCLEQNTIAEIERGFVCYTHQGYRAFSGGNVSDEDLSYGITNELRKATVSKMLALFQDKELWISVDDDSSENNTVYVRNFRNQTGWTKFINISAAAMVLDENNDILTTDGFDGLIYQQKIGFTDRWVTDPYDGEVIEIDIQSKDYFLDDLVIDKELQTLLSLMNNSSDVRLFIYRDFQQSEQEYIIKPKQEGFQQWDEPWGKPWIRGTRSRKTRLRFKERGSFFGVRYRQGPKELGEISGGRENTKTDNLLEIVGFTVIMSALRED